MKTFKSTLLITLTLTFIWLTIAVLAIIGVLPAYSTLLTIPLSPFIGIGLGKLTSNRF